MRLFEVQRKLVEKKATEEEVQRKLVWKKATEEEVPKVPDEELMNKL